MANVLVNENSLSAIANAIREKSGSSDTYKPAEMAPAILNIPTGGGEEVPRKAVNYYDYDGTLVHSYTRAEFAALLDHPELPTHDGLTAEKWNWAFAEAQAFVAAGGELYIGPHYDTSDGKTRVMVELESGRLSPYLGLSLYGSAEIDWGDGSAPETMTGASAAQTTFLQHAYSESGPKTITITPAAGAVVNIAGQQSGTFLLTASGNTSYDARNRAYASAITGVHIGAGVWLQTYAFAQCRQLKFCTFPSTQGGLTVTIPTGAFAYCSGLRAITVSGTLSDTALTYCYGLQWFSSPAGAGVSALSSCYGIRAAMTDGAIGQSAFASCNSLSVVYIGPNVRSIGNGAFASGSPVGALHFLSDTPPVASSSGTFSELPSDCKIYVPHGKLDTYKAATNYPSPSTYTYIEED